MLINIFSIHLFGINADAVSKLKAKNAYPEMLPKLFLFVDFILGRSEVNIFHTNYCALFKISNTNCYIVLDYF